MFWLPSLWLWLWALYGAFGREQKDLICGGKEHEKCSEEELGQGFGRLICLGENGCGFQKIWIESNGGGDDDGNNNRNGNDKKKNLEMKREVTIECQNAHSCQNTTIFLMENTRMILECRDVFSCHNMYVHTSPSSELIWNCDEKTSCGGMNLDCNGDCLVDCNDFSSSFPSPRVNCHANSVCVWMLWNEKNANEKTQNDNRMDLKKENYICEPEARCVQITKRNEKDKPNKTSQMSQWNSNLGWLEVKKTTYQYPQTFLEKLLGPKRPSRSPTAKPVTSKSPTKNPTVKPSNMPTSVSPTTTPTLVPTSAPIVTPTKKPSTATPTKSPTSSPIKSTEIVLTSSVGQSRTATTSSSGTTGVVVGSSIGALAIIGCLVTAIIVVRRRKQDKEGQPPKESTMPRLTSTQKSDLMGQGKPGIAVCHAFEILHQYEHDIQSGDSKKKMLVKMNPMLWLETVTNELTRKKDSNDNDSQIEQVKSIFLVMHTFPEKRDELIRNPKLILTQDFQNSVESLKDTSVTQQNSDNRVRVTAFTPQGIPATVKTGRAVPVAPKRNKQNMLATTVDISRIAQPQLITLGENDEERERHGSGRERQETEIEGATKNTLLLCSTEGEGHAIVALEIDEDSTPGY